MTKTYCLPNTALIMALSAVYPLSATAAVSAGVAQFIAGEVNVRRPDGGTVPLAKGKDIESGQSILTGVNGRAQVKFSDGGLISLQPNTEFKIANYVDQADPKQDRFLVDLLRGSMRAITGLIGKRNRENYKVTTTTATIGIRGSGFNVGYNPDGSLGVTTELDAIEVCNAGGCVGLTAGESVRVVSSQEAPVRTNTRASVPTPASPEQEPTVAGNQTNADGKATLIDGKASNTGTFSTLKVAASYRTDGGPTYSQIGPGVATSATLKEGALTELTSAGNVFAPSTVTSVGSMGSIATNDFVGWGTWVTASKNSATALSNLHYVVVQPATAIPSSGVATYSLAGGTAPTRYDQTSNTMTTGTLTSGSLSVDFTNSKLSVTINTSLGNVALTNVGVINGQFGYSDGSQRVDGSFGCINAGCAALAYQKVVVSTSTTTLNGAAAFKKN